MDWKNTKKRGIRSWGVSLLLVGAMCVTAWNPAVVYASEDVTEVGGIGETAAASTASKEETSPEDTLPAETTPAETTSAGTEPGEGSSESISPTETLPEETSPEETLPTESQPGETVPGVTLPGETVPGATLPGETLPGVTLPVEILPGVTLPGETVPGATLPDETLPGATLPVETVPAATLPSETLPGVTLPGETLPVETLPVETLPAETLPRTLVVKQTPLDLEALRAAMPVNQSAIRSELALKAYSLVGQVGYFWGGKSAALGWDSRWDAVSQVTIAGSPSTGTFRSYGLDCSGFVGWVYVNAFQDPAVLGALGSVTSEQWANSYEVSWEEAMVGDLVFRRSPSPFEVNHVGIIVDRDENGNVKIAHCSSSHNNVIVVEGTSNFHYVRRPYFMKDECACTVEVANVIRHTPECREYTGLNTDPQATDPFVWDSEEQLTADLRSLFPDAAFAEAVAEALWETCSEPIVGHNVPDAEEYRCLNLNHLGYARLVDLVSKAKLSVSRVGETPEERAEREKETAILEARRAAGEDVVIPKYDTPTLVTNLEGIQYLQSARKIDLAYNNITSLAPLDGQREDQQGNAIYQWSVYYQENGVWQEDAAGTLHENCEYCPYFGGGVPYTPGSYATILNLEGNPLQEIPDNLPGRLILCHLELPE